MSTTFSANFGSLESLNGRDRCGLRPCSFHTRCTVVTNADLRGQHPRAPMRGVLGLLLGCPRHDRKPQFGTDRLLARPRPLAPVLEQALDAAFHVGFLPTPNRGLRYPSLALNR